MKRSSLFGLIGLLASAGMTSGQTFTFDTDLKDTSGAVELQPFNVFGSGQLPPAASGQIRVADGALTMEATHFGRGTSRDPSILGTVLGPTRIAVFKPTPCRDFRVSVDILEQGVDVSGQNEVPTLAILARLTDIGPGTADGYAFRLIDFLDVGPGIVMDRLVNEEPIPIRDENGHRGDSFSGWDKTKQYRLVFEGRGPKLTGTLFDLSAPAVPIASLTRFDSMYSAGVTAALLAVPTGDTAAAWEVPVKATFDNFLSELPAPEVAIEHAVRLTWPTAPSGYTLEAADKPEGPYAVVEPTPVVVGGVNELFLVTKEGQRYFRLVKAP